VDEYFDKWEVTGLDTTGMDLTKTEIKFQMPAGNVTFKATYLRVTKYGIVIVDGTKDKEVAKAGETVTIIANPAKEGKVFDKWTCETAGVTIEFASATSSKTTFEMPACEITIQAHFRDKDDKPSIEIKVEGGMGGGAYKEGETITITANDPAEGKVFKCWQDTSGKIVSTEKIYTFTVTEETTLTAVYDDMPSGGGEITPPAKKDGLSGGQIACIVIGALLIAGIGGFAIFWFAVKKKSFGDLITAIKGINKKKQ
ncbi:MAG: InlB B-repeat-containing protein, partial [Bacilli bacterium]|nr:InlB B-repeat-containing protein [Bacilli bacterium]